MGWRVGLASWGGNEAEGRPGEQRYDKCTYAYLNVYIFITLPILPILPIFALQTGKIGK